MTMITESAVVLRRKSSTFSDTCTCSNNNVEKKEEKKRNKRRRQQHHCDYVNQTMRFFFKTNHRHSSSSSSSSSSSTKPPPSFYGGSFTVFMALLFVTSFTSLMEYIKFHRQLTRTRKRASEDNATAANGITSNNYHHDNNNNNNNNQIDFVTTGFPKCGTSTLLYAFEAHPEVMQSKYEMCGGLTRFPNGVLSDWKFQSDIMKLVKMREKEAVIAEEEEEEEEMVATNNNRTTDGDNIAKKSIRTKRHHKLAMKCPFVVMSKGSIQRIDRNNPNAKFLVTIRHPIFMVESMYNYLVVLLRERLHVPAMFIPSIQTIVSTPEIVHDIIVAIPGPLQYIGGLLRLASYRDDLMNFKNTILMRQPINDDGGDVDDPASAPRIFFLLLEQLKDPNATRNEEFRSNIQHFLGLKQPLRSMIRPTNYNRDRYSAFTEAIRICDDTPFFHELRRTILQGARTTVDWIEHHFLTDPGVQTSNRDFIIETLHSYTHDPCSSDGSVNGHEVEEKE